MHPFAITVVTETYLPEINGVANTLGHLVRGLLCDENLSVQIVRPQQSALDTATKEERHEVFVVRGLPIPGYNELRFGLPCKKKLVKLWQQQPPDVIYLATEGPLGKSALAAARQLNIPTLSGFHTNFHRYIEHYHLGWAKPLVFRHLRKFHNNTKGTLVPTENQAEQLRQDGFDNISVMGRGVDLELFSPNRRDHALRQSWGVEPEEIVLIYVGRLAAEKNLDLAIKTFERSSDQGLTRKLIIVGDGPIYSDLKKRDDPRIILCGTQTGEALARHYASADIFLFPSLTDTFGNVVTEAMASGLAVISFNYAAAQMHIQHGISGYVVPFADHAKYRETCHLALKNRKQLTDVKAQAREHAETLGWPKIVQHFKAKLEQITTGETAHAIANKTSPRITTH